MKKTIYTFIGLPASGKGTQAEILAKKLGLANPIGIGDLIREVIESSADNDPFVSEIKKRYNAGTPQPDEVAIDLLTRKIESTDSDIVLDNFPFTEKQATFLDQFIAKNAAKYDGPKVIYIKVDPEIAVKRVTTRKVCSDCGSIFGSTDEMICEKCGGALVVRSDDNVDTVRTRIEHYLPKIAEVIDYYKSTGRDIWEINGENTVAEVSAEINRKL